MNDTHLQAEKSNLHLLQTTTGSQVVCVCVISVSIFSIFFCEISAINNFSEVQMVSKSTAESFVDFKQILF